jgi:hypothetical protein
MVEVVGIAKQLSDFVGNWISAERQGDDNFWGCRKSYAG